MKSSLYFFHTKIIQNGGSHDMKPRSGFMRAGRSTALPADLNKKNPQN